MILIFLANKATCSQPEQISLTTARATDSSCELSDTVVVVALFSLKHIFIQNPNDIKDSFLSCRVENVWRAGWSRGLGLGLGLGGSRRGSGLCDCCRSRLSTGFWSQNCFCLANRSAYSQDSSRRAAVPLPNSYPLDPPPSSVIDVYHSA